MKLFPTLYGQNGDLMAPPAAQQSQTAIPGTPVTLDADWYHAHADMFPTAAQRDRAFEAFLDKMRQVPGYMTLKDEKFTVTIGTFVRYNYRVMYVIEDRATAAEMRRRAQNGTLPPLMIQEMFQGLQRYAPQQG